MLLYDVGAHRPPSPQTLKNTSTRLYWRRSRPQHVFQHSMYLYTIIISMFPYRLGNYAHLNTGALIRHKILYHLDSYK
jgi:hypothetical protein